LWTIFIAIVVAVLAAVMAGTDAPGHCLAWPPDKAVQVH
jgi:hypothetical protein